MSRPLPDKNSRVRAARRSIGYNAHFVEGGVSKPLSDINHAVQPASLDLDLKEQVLQIAWADGAISRLRMPVLRKHCPCAACRSEKEQQRRTLLPVLKSAPADRIEAIGGQLVGNYALQIEWSDGHSTGIYDFRYLRSLPSE